MRRPFRALLRRAKQARRANRMLEHDEASPADEAPAAADRAGVCLTVAYDGRPFSGFARQHKTRTIAGELDGAIRTMDPRASPVRGASRTDRGVHAYSQVVAFDSRLHIAPRGWVLGLAAHLPDEISVVQAAHVPIGYAPHHHAVRKTYAYKLLQSRVRDPFLDGRAWRVANRLNHMEMKKALECIVGVHDFRAFRAAADHRQNTIRHIYRVSVERDLADPRCILVIVEGNRFMYRMVRIIVGALVDIGVGKLQSDALQCALASGRRSDLGITAPPDGLYLMDVQLDLPGSDPWPTAQPID